MQPKGTLNLHACCQLLSTWSPGARSPHMLKHITRQWYHQYESCSLTEFMLLQPLQMVTGHTWASFHMLEKRTCAAVALADTQACHSHRKDQLTKTRGETDNHMHTRILHGAQTHQPLCCCSLHQESFHNASSETCPAQTVVSCPAGRKNVALFIFVNIADLRSNLIYLHKITNFTPSAGPPRAINNVYLL